MVRHLLVDDLPKQMANDFELAEMTWWRAHMIEVVDPGHAEDDEDDDTKDAKKNKGSGDRDVYQRSWLWDREFHRMQCAKRFVFSKYQTADEPASLTGKWLVVAYLYAESRQVLEKLDVKELPTLLDSYW